MTDAIQALKPFGRQTAAQQRTSLAQSTSRKPDVFRQAVDKTRLSAGRRTSAQTAQRIEIDVEASCCERPHRHPEDKRAECPSREIERTHDGLGCHAERELEVH